MGLFFCTLFKGFSRTDNANWHFRADYASNAWWRYCFSGSTISRGWALPVKPRNILRNQKIRGECRKTARHLWWDGLHSCSKSKICLKMFLYLSFIGLVVLLIYCTHQLLHDGWSIYSHLWTLKDFLCVFSKVQSWVNQNNTGCWNELGRSWKIVFRGVLLEKLNQNWVKCLSKIWCIFWRKELIFSVENVLLWKRSIIFWWFLQFIDKDVVTIFPSSENKKEVWFFQEYPKLYHWKVLTIRSSWYI